MAAVAVYYLIDPRDNQIRYVGKSIRPHDRHRRHCRNDSGYAHLHSRRWIERLFKQGLKPILRIVCWAEEDQEAWRYEVALIAILRAKNVPLTNISQGGDGRGVGFRHTPASRLAIKRGMRKSIKQQQKRKRGPWSPEQREANRIKRQPVWTLEKRALHAGAISDGWAKRRAAGLKRAPNGKSKNRKKSKENSSK